LFLQEQSKEVEVIDIDLNDPALNDAAIKIQAQYKGFKTRKDLKEAHNI
jgi:hypothetical protein